MAPDRKSASLPCSISSDLLGDAAVSPGFHLWNLCQTNYPLGRCFAPHGRAHLLFSYLPATAGRDSQRATGYHGNVQVEPQLLHTNPRVLSLGRLSYPRCNLLHPFHLSMMTQFPDLSLPARSIIPFSFNSFILRFAVLKLRTPDLVHQK